MRLYLLEEVLEFQR